MRGSMAGLWRVYGWSGAGRWWVRRADQVEDGAAARAECKVCVWWGCAGGMNPLILAVLRSGVRMGKQTV